MRIAYFLDMQKGLGGAGNLLLQQAYLMSSIYNVLVIIPSDENGSSNEEYTRRCDKYNLRHMCIEYDTAYNFTMLNFMGAMHSAELIEEMAKEERIDFFHSVQLNIAVEYVSRKLGIPHLMNIYQLQEHEFRICQGHIYPKFHLCDSLLYSKIWSSNIKIKSKCIRPVALSDFIVTKERYSRNTIKILMLGTVCVRKNQMTAIKAVSKCVNSGKRIELHILGANNNSYAKECEEYIKDENLEKVVYFHGFVSDITMFLEDGDCLLCSSVDESFPSSIVEALTYDLTIISTPVAGVPEIFVDKENSFISKDFSADSIAESILTCLKYYENGKVSQIHVNAIQTWLKHFDRKIVREQLDLYYKQIAEDQSFESVEPFLQIKEKIKQENILANKMGDTIDGWIYKRCLYYIIVKQALSKGKIYIWGAGNYGIMTAKILERMCPALEIVAFVDKNRKGEVEGIPIKRIDEIPINPNFFYSVSFTGGRNEAIKFLENKRLVLYKNIWTLPY